MSDYPGQPAQPGQPGEWWGDSQPGGVPGGEAPIAPPPPFQPTAPSVALGPPPTGNPGGSRTKLLVAGIAVAIIAVGITIALVVGGGEPEKLSAKQYVGQLCDMADPIVADFPSTEELFGAVVPGAASSDVDAARKALDISREFVEKSDKLLAAEQEFTASHEYSGTGGKELRLAIESGSKDLRKALQEQLGSLDKIAKKYAEFEAIDNPSSSDADELDEYVADVKEESNSVMPEQRELPGDSDILFAAAQVGDEPITGDLEDALSDLDEAAQESSACDAVLDYGN